MNGAFRGAIVGALTVSVGVPLGAFFVRLVMANAGLILAYMVLTTLYDHATGHTARVEQLAALTPATADFAVSGVRLIGNDNSYRLREIALTVTSRAKIAIANPRVHCTYDYTYFEGGKPEADAFTTDAMYVTVEPKQSIRLTTTRMGGNVLAEIRNMRNVQCTLVDFENLFAHQSLPR